MQLRAHGWHKEEVQDEAARGGDCTVQRGVCAHVSTSATQRLESESDFLLV